MIKIIAGVALLLLLLSFGWYQFMHKKSEDIRG